MMKESSCDVFHATDAVLVVSPGLFAALSLYGH
jgi:hypothetical protein